LGAADKAQPNEPIHVAASPRDLASDTTNAMAALTERLRTLSSRQRTVSIRQLRRIRVVVRLALEADLTTEPACYDLRAMSFIHQREFWNGPPERQTSGSFD
jgi:hypothetical protein